MNKLVFCLKCISFFVLLFFTITGHSQTGNTMQNPVVVGSFSYGFQYVNSLNTSNFTNNYSGRPSNDVFYKFTLSAPMDVVINHCGSSISDTYLHLLDASGKLVAYNDDLDNTCSSHYHSYIRKNLYQGTYYVVSEGYSQNGVIKTSISGSTTMHGNTFDDPIELGVLDSNFSCSDTQNTSYFTNNFTGKPSNDVFYKFTLRTPMEIIINHCGSSISDTYLHLLDESGSVILYNNDYSLYNCCSNSLNSYLKTVLQEGIYYVVSEGYAGNGSIHTTIEGHLASLSYSYDVCGNRITRYTNESTPGIANLRSSGGGKEKPDDSTAALNNTVDDDSSVILHPNPTDGIFTIEFTDNIDLSNAFIHIVNIDGLTIFSQKVQTEKVVIDLSVFSAGTYLVKIQSDKQNITKKLLKK